MTAMTELSDAERIVRNTIADQILNWRDSQLDEAHGLGDYGAGYLAGLDIAWQIALGAPDEATMRSVLDKSATVVQVVSVDQDQDERS